MIRAFTSCCFLVSLFVARATCAETSEISEDDQQITIVTPQLEASIRKKGYVSGVAAGTLRDIKTGFRDAGFGLDIVDWVMEPGSDEAYRDLSESFSAAFIVGYFDTISEMHKVYDEHKGFTGLTVSEESWE